MSIDTLKKELIELKRLETVANAAYDAWESDPGNADFEKSADVSYELEFSQMQIVARLLAKFANTDIKTAYSMLRNPEYREKLDDLLK